MENLLLKIPGVGQARLAQLQKLGVETPWDLMRYFPRSYHDLTQPSTTSQMTVGRPWFGKLSIVSPAKTVFPRKGFSMTRCQAEDEEGKVTLVWYNQPYIRQQLKEEETLFFYGRPVFRMGEIRLENPMIERASDEDALRMLPVYRLTKGLSQGNLRACIKQCFALYAGYLSEPLPRGLREAFGLYAFRDALELSHFPPSETVKDQAVRTVCFTDLLLLRAYLGDRRTQRGTAQPLCITQAQGERFMQQLGFAPTGAQQRVMRQIQEDLEKTVPMSRLVQGDVGCGKTVVAFYAMWIAAQNGRQAALMAPTDILAGQHYEQAKALFEPLGVSVGLLKSGMKAAERRQVLEALEDGTLDLVVGTHALISESVKYKNLGLVIADEQHRFGVKQRAALMQKGTENHALFMSATPIPRTLSMILYGDLDVSVIDEMPPGRKPVETRIVLANKRDDMYAFLADRARQGGQAYVVCPRIEGEEEDDQAAEQIYTMMKKRFADVSIGLLHGKMKQAEKQEIMEQFAQNHIQILVSTTVVEVGVNVPNATVMVIERADRFGLAQLHQLRGRVGRGSAQSWCFLAAEREDRQRLLTMTQTQDGFEVAKADLELRGPGSFLGEEQHGFTDAGALMLTKDAGLVEEVNRAYELLQQPQRQADWQMVLCAAKKQYEDALGQIAMN